MASGLRHHALRHLRRLRTLLPRCSLARHLGGPVAPATMQLPVVASGVMPVQGSSPAPNSVDTRSAVCAAGPAAYSPMQRKFVMVRKHHWLVARVGIETVNDWAPTPTTIPFTFNITFVNLTLISIDVRRVPLSCGFSTLLFMPFHDQKHNWFF